MELYSRHRESSARIDRGQDRGGSCRKGISMNGSDRGTSLGDLGAPSGTSEGRENSSSGTTCRIPDIKNPHVLCVDTCLLYTSDAADDTPCVDLGGRRIIKKKKKIYNIESHGVGV
eukprot:TRINITY_DN3961_c0_g1_i8.p2 TRINITY_DN3961_c0_g1~~TRINITY_DN3961_c0_g1_i8.p2  ORF type:complete len:116 (-),score=14.00 TRINITY_DN3961_c0_g1_i8:53-400(-)